MLVARGPGPPAFVRSFASNPCVLGALAEPARARCHHPGLRETARVGTWTRSKREAGLITRRICVRAKFNPSRSSGLAGYNFWFRPGKARRLPSDLPNSPGSNSITAFTLLACIGKGCLCLLALCSVLSVVVLYPLKSSLKLRTRRKTLLKICVWYRGSSSRPPTPNIEKHQT